MNLTCLVFVLLSAVGVLWSNEAVYVPSKVAQQQQQQQQQTCYSFPKGLEVESRYSDVGDQRWANQCPASTMLTALWFKNRQSTVDDVKCCHGNVDQTLSHPILDFHYFDKGVVEPSAQWQVECKPNHVVTALHLSENPVNAYTKHVNAMKCALLVDAVVNKQKCVKIDNAVAVGGSRLANATWSAQCPNKMAVVALFDNDSFKTVQFTKCCQIQDKKLSLPFHCDFSTGDLCGWTQDIDDEADWQLKGANGGNYHYLSFDVNARGGVARISSPGYSTRSLGMCLRMYYFISGYRPRIEVLLRYNDHARRVQNITTLKSIQSPLGRPSTIDVIVSTASNFQIVIEGMKSPEHVSLINIMDLKLLSTEECKVDACSPPSLGCGLNAYCIPVGGYLRCTCKEGFQMTNDQCHPINPRSTLEPTPKEATEWFTAATGSRNGGEGKDGKEGEITAPPYVTSGKGGKGELPNGGKGTKFKKSSGGPLTNWMYSGLGGVAGVILTGVAIVLLFAYRRRLLKSRRHVCFDMELRQRRPASETNSPPQRKSKSVSHLTVPNGAALASWQCKPFRSASLGSSASFVETNLGNASPESHHYFVVEPTIDDPQRKISEGLLSTPVYGSGSELNGDTSTDGDLFFEPPNDEKELRAQLKRELPRNSIRIDHKTLGQGAFGYVKLGTWKKRCDSIVKVAVKMLKEPVTPKDRVMFFREAVIMSQFAHTNVVYMYGVMTTKYPPMIVLEYMSHGNLKRYLLKEDKSRNSSCVITRDLHCMLLRFAREIAAGMTYLSNLKFVHRDLAARNILLNANLTCKIGDFGLARDLIGSDHYTSNERRCPVKWTAPEALLFQRFSSASDVWSFGIVLYEIWALGHKPYKDLDNRMVTDLVCNRKFRLPPPQACPRIIYHIMMDCWHPKPEKRPVFSQLKYCLGQSDSRLIGKETDGRRRSTTLNNLPAITPEDSYGDLQFTYYRSE